MRPPSLIEAVTDSEVIRHVVNIDEVLYDQAWIPHFIACGKG